MLLCWCIGKTASRIEEFYMLPHDGKLYKYDRMAINMIVDNIKGELSFCDIAVTDDLEQFNADYQQRTETIRQTCQDILDEDAVIVGTSTLNGTELDCIVNQYSGIYTNPFLAWGRYRKGWLKTTLPVRHSPVPYGQHRQVVALLGSADNCNGLFGPIRYFMISLPLTMRMPRAFLETRWPARL